MWPAAGDSKAVPCDPLVEKFAELRTNVFSQHWAELNHVACGMYCIGPTYLSLPVP